MRGEIILLGAICYYIFVLIFTEKLINYFSATFPYCILFSNKQVSIVWKQNHSTQCTDEESNKSVEDGDETFKGWQSISLKSYKIGITVTNFQKLGFKTNYTEKVKLL